MNNDIKKILDKFDKILENYELDKKLGGLSIDSICHLFPYELITIKDYITNLQEENEKLKDQLCNITTMTVCGDRKQIKNTAQYKLDIVQDRIDKAIGYIENREWVNCEDCVNQVYDILRGEDNERI